MWREGFDLTLFAWILNVLALGFGGALGARALIDPRWAARFARLKPDDKQPGGEAEFRATFGGVFFASHAAALLMSVSWISSGAAMMGVYAAGAAVALAAGWAGSSGGRVLASLFDGVRTRFNTICAGVEALLALMIAAPWIVWVLAPPG